MMEFKIIENELKVFNNGLKKAVNTSLEIYSEVLTYILNTKGKQIRPVIGILVAKMLGDFNDKQNHFLQAIELIHNATLFHDDIIDEAEIRRNTITLHKKFSNKIAILSGDYFLSVALKLISELDNGEINTMVANYVKLICEGEIEQNLTLNKLLPLENYLNKTKNKTALLFELTTLGISILSDNNCYNDDLRKFGENFGMIFQLKDDLNNFEVSSEKSYNNDLKSGVITAPIIFLAQEYSNVENLLAEEKYDMILQLLNKSNAKNKTKELICLYIEKAKNNLSGFYDNKYKQILLELTSQF